MRIIGYNSQRDNFDFKGLFSASCQCFSTSAWMLLSFYVKSIIATDDQGLKRYVDDVSDTVGVPGVGEKIKRLHSYISGNSAYWWDVQKAGIESWLDHLGGRCVFKDGNCTMTELVEQLSKGPVIIGTNKMGGLPGGHIILAVDCEGKSLICNDPYGNALTSYRNVNGEMVYYPIDWIRKFIGGDKIRCMWYDINKPKGS
jgi:hypothetical protein